MAHIEIAPWEPEETVGKLWHLIASRMDPPPRFPEAAVRFDDMRGRIAVLFRGLGGASDVELKPVADQASRDTVDQIASTPVGRQDRPQTDVVLSSVEVERVDS